MDPSESIWESSVIIQPDIRFGNIQRLRWIYYLNLIGAGQRYQVHHGYSLAQFQTGIQHKRRRVHQSEFIEEDKIYQICEVTFTCVIERERQ